MVLEKLDQIRRKLFEPKRTEVFLLGNIGDAVKLHESRATNVSLQQSSTPT